MNKLEVAKEAAKIKLDYPELAIEEAIGKAKEVLKSD